MLDLPMLINQMEEAMKNYAKKLGAGAILLILGVIAANPVFGADKAPVTNPLTNYIGQCITVGVEGGPQLLEFVGTLISVGAAFLELDVPVESGGEPTGETVQIYAALGKVAFFVPDNPFTELCDANQPASAERGASVASLGQVN